MDTAPTFSEEEEEEEEEEEDKSSDDMLQSMALYDEINSCTISL